MGGAVFVGAALVFAVAPKSIRTSSDMQDSVVSLDVAWQPGTWSDMTPEYTKCYRYEGTYDGQVVMEGKHDSWEGCERICTGSGYLAWTYDPNGNCKVFTRGEHVPGAAASGWKAGVCALPDCRAPTGVKKFI